MALFYEDLVKPTIVKQVSRQIAYCRCIRSKNLRFCDGSHAATTLAHACLNLMNQDYCYLPLLEIKRPSGTHGRRIKPKDRPKRGHE